MRLLLIEDDTALGHALHAGLRQEAAADWFRTAEEGDEALRSTTYDVLVLDINLPGMSGLQWLTQLRARQVQLPVLLLTARDTISQRVEGLNAGADDYLVKPFDFDELLARIRALARRRGTLQENLLQHGHLQLNLSARSALWKGKNVPLSHKEFAILHHLLTHVGHCRSKEQIEMQLYGWDDEIGSNTVEVHISSLRRKLDRQLIRTLRGAGYILEAQP